MYTNVRTKTGVSAEIEGAARLASVQVGVKEEQEQVVDDVRWQVLVFKPETHHDTSCAERVCPSECDGLYFFLERAVDIFIPTLTFSVEMKKQTDWGWVMLDSNS